MAGAGLSVMIACQNPARPAWNWGPDVVGMSIVWGSVPGSTVVVVVRGSVVVVVDVVAAARTARGEPDGVRVSTKAPAPAASRVNTTPTPMRRRTIRRRRRRAARLVTRAPYPRGQAGRRPDRDGQLEGVVGAAALPEPAPAPRSTRIWRVAVPLVPAAPAP